MTRDRVFLSEPSSVGTRTCSAPEPYRETDTVEVAKAGEDKPSEAGFARGLALARHADVHSCNRVFRHDSIQAHEVSDSRSQVRTVPSEIDQSLKDSSPSGKLIRMSFQGLDVPHLPLLVRAPQQQTEMWDVCLVV